MHAAIQAAAELLAVHKIHIWTYHVVMYICRYIYYHTKCRHSTLVRIYWLHQVCHQSKNKTAVTSWEHVFFFSFGVRATCKPDIAAFCGHMVVVASCDHGLHCSDELM